MPDVCIAILFSRDLGLSKGLRKQIFAEYIYIYISMKSFVPHDLVFFLISRKILTIERYLCQDGILAEVILS